MKLYRALAEDEHGKKYAGTFQAAGDKQARELLLRDGYIRVLELEEIKDKPLTEEKIRFRKKGKDKEPYRGTASSASEAAGWARYIPKLGPRSSGIIKTFVLAATILACIPYLLSLMPVAQSQEAPGEIVRAYFAAELSGHYEDHYPLFSKQRQFMMESASQYLKRRESTPAETLPSEETKESVAFLEGIEIMKKSARSAEITAFVRRGPWVDPYAVNLILEKGLWKINRVIKQERVASAPTQPKEPRPGKRNTHQQATTFEKPTGSERKDSMQRPGTKLHEFSGRTENQQLYTELRQSIEEAREKGKITEESYRRKLELLDSMNA